MAAVAGGSTGVAVGQFLAVVGEDGALFVGGSGLRGQLGTGTSRGDADDRHAPTLIAELPAPTRQIAAGVSHTSIVTDSCDLLMRGCGVNGRLGLGDEGDRNAPTLVARALLDGTAVLMVACGQWRTAALTEGGGVYTFGCGRHTVALIEEGHLYTLGRGRVRAAGAQRSRAPFCAGAGGARAIRGREGRVCGGRETSDSGGDDSGAAVHLGGWC